MFFFYIIFMIFVLLFLIVKYLTIEIHLQNIKFATNGINGKKLNKNYKIKIKLYLFEKIKIFKIDITKIKNKKIKRRFYKFEKKMIEQSKKFDIKSLKAIKYLKPKIKKADLKIDIGLKDAGASAICVGFLSTIIGILFRNMSQKDEDNFWRITPIYKNKNLLNISLDCIFSFKLIHIINTIYFIR